MCLNPGDIVNLKNINGQDKQVQKYKIIKELGRGGFGITYTAHDLNHSATIVVLKQIKVIQSDAEERERDSEYLEKLTREADALKRLEYPGIPQFYTSFFDTSFEAEEYYYIAQEYIEGHDLSQEILPGQPMEEEDARIILQEILEILEFVHQNNIIHRDIKPANIVRRQSDHKLHLIDFGAVKEIATKHKTASGITLTQAFISRGYTPPEQLLGKPRLNSDIYALGITIMHAVTGFDIRAIANPDRVPRQDEQNNCNYIWEQYAPQISSELKQIISRMIEYRYSDRYQNVNQILQDLIRTIAIDPPPVILPDKPHLIKDLFTRYWKQIKFILTTIFATLFSILIWKIILPPSNICSSNIIYSNLVDHVSCGEEILDPLSKGTIRKRAAEKYQQQKYSKALQYFQESWQRER